MLTTTIDVPKEQEQALTVQTTVKAKDPKKQEAGRKGAMARRQKLEALLAQSQAAKEKKMDSEPKTRSREPLPIPVPHCCCCGWRGIVRVIANNRDEASRRHGNDEASA